MEVFCFLGGDILNRRLKKKRIARIEQTVRKDRAEMLKVMYEVEFEVVDSSISGTTITGSMRVRVK